ncbi:hypothetical protein TREPR_1898 [Treponema primitia ZAS-2]|uniref:Uncharacterized protein n=1 Tax=Treponema primitia (strain ATCC BAA-887 / DSM 12427 / ZAS-2) TaxID=545694 RepID=F5YL35_TREPZ|nr:hypothetical protein [Treponema primitia]AEF86586.1 hypothetical protein TREPR_1898 [Treponema primitia ZAS-2]
MNQMEFDHQAVAYWISPKGKILGLSEWETHIKKVIENPAAFGYTKENIQAIYDSYHELLGTENAAREEIMKDLLNSGWIRIRNNGSFYTIQIAKLSKNSKDYIFDWAANLISWVGPLTGVLIKTNTETLNYSITEVVNGKLVKNIKGRKRIQPVGTVFDL